MIHTSRQLKALVRNRSKGDSTKAQIIIRNYVMERFLERLSVSPYRDNLILKGGVLVSAIVGLNNRSTMDIDATIKNFTLSVESAKELVAEIIAIQLDDGMSFEIKDVDQIMDEADYPEVRVLLNTAIETMRTPLKIDLSTGDAVTPAEISYDFRLMFEDRSISILAYNLETVLAEKLETIISRGTANTRMRDFYDSFILMTAQLQKIDPVVLRIAFVNTCNYRGSQLVASDATAIINEIQDNPDIMMLWNRYQKKFDYAAAISWNDVLAAIRKLYSMATAV